MKLLSNTKALMGIVIALMSAIIVTSVIYITSAPSGIDIPDFSEKTKEDVQTWISDNEVDSNLVTFSYAYDEDKDQDIVLSQSMAAGEKLTKDNILTITLSNGPDPGKEFTLPDFSGKDKKEVSKWFTDNKFSTVTYAFSPDEEVEKDIFLKCSAEKGSKVKRSDKITVTISTGTDEEEAEEITVPDFSAYTKANISAWGTTNNVTIMFRTQTSDTIAEGKFISQSVKAGTKVKKGSGITITLSSGKALSAIDYTGKAKSEAAAWISKEGLKAVYQEYYSDTVAEGYIIDQTPKSGAIDAGTTITFQVSLGKVSITDYTGKTQGEFENYINTINAKVNGSKFTVKAENEESSEKAGTILSQSAKGETTLGTTITIKVATAKQINVTSQAGKSLSDFKNYLSGLGLNIGNIAYQYSSSAKDTIVSNDTGTYAQGSSVNCVVSKGEYTWDYSSYIKAGSSWNSLWSASATARANGYSVSKADVESDTYDTGIIVQDCSVNGKSISCQVSSGKVATVPDVTGKTKDEAAAILQNAGFQVTPIEGTAAVNGGNKVVSQSPAGGTKTKAGSSVSITYTPDVPMLTLPSIPSYGLYNGQKAEDIAASVTNTFQKAGFTNIKINYIDSSGDTNSDYLYSIDPKPDGSSVPASTAITVTIYKGKSN